jgi:hypothetical protein
MANKGADCSDGHDWVVDDSSIIQSRKCKRCENVEYRLAVDISVDSDKARYIRECLSDCEAIVRLLDIGRKLH